VVIAALSIEGAARLVFAHKRRLIALMPARMSPLHRYQELDPGRAGTWRLKAGFVETFGDAMTADRRGDHAADEMFIRINRDGFRGPEIDWSRPAQKILMIGDSATFGSIEHSSYPRVAERELRQGGAPDLEVINAGVEGYSPRDVLHQMDRYLVLRPAIVTIYIGWGSLYSETHALDELPGWIRLDSLRLLSLGFSYLRTGLQDPEVRAREAQAAARAAKVPAAAAPELDRLNGFVPTFMGDVEEMVHAFRSAGSTVVLVTLPGLYTVDSAPTVKALRMGNMPTFTNNPYVLAKMADRYNDELRALASRHRLKVVDLDAWSRTALLPREEHFVDSVHLTEASQEKVGRYIASELAPLLNPARVATGMPRTVPARR
jgi:lysophospholipase L1-like esterase